MARGGCACLGLKPGNCSNKGSRHRNQTLLTPTCCNHFKRLGLDHQRAIKIARKLHATLLRAPTSLLLLGVLSKTILLLIARFWSRVLPVNL
eukprot:1158001-Pelagomonas_calceolata.AAC.7